MTVEANTVFFTLFIFIIVMLLFVTETLNSNVTMMLCWIYTTHRETEAAMCIYNPNYYYY